MEEEEKVPKKNYLVSFIRKLSVAENLTLLIIQKKEAFTQYLITMVFQDLQ